MPRQSSAVGSFDTKAHCRAGDRGRLEFRNCLTILLTTCGLKVDDMNKVQGTILTKITLATAVVVSATWYIKVFPAAGNTYILVP